METIQVVMTAAETGHLVFSTLHTIGAANTIERIIDVFPPNQQPSDHDSAGFCITGSDLSAADTNDGWNIDSCV